MGFFNKLKSQKQKTKTKTFVVLSASRGQKKNERIFDVICDVLSKCFKRSLDELHEKKIKINCMENYMKEFTEDFSESFSELFQYKIGKNHFFFYFCKVKYFFS